MNQLIENFFELKIKELLDTIQTNYEEHITTNIIDNELKYIKSKIKFKLLSEKEFNIIYPKKSKNKKKNKLIIPSDLQCQGRVWGKITMDKDKNKIYGCRCKNKKIKNSNYCYIHNYKLTHGNFLKPPDKYIKYHFNSFYNKKKEKER